jgi:hypothetical protein
LNRYVKATPSASIGLLMLIWHQNLDKLEIISCIFARDLVALLSVCYKLLDPKIKAAASKLEWNICEQVYVNKIIDLRSEVGKMDETE